MTAFNNYLHVDQRCPRDRCANNAGLAVKVAFKKSMTRPVIKYAGFGFLKTIKCRFAVLYFNPLVLVFGKFISQFTYLIFAHEPPIPAFR
jgi:hypothetical protein